MKESGPLGPRVGRQIGRVKKVVVSEGGGGAGVELLVRGFGWRRGRRRGRGGEAVEAWRAEGRGEEFAVAREAEEGRAALVEKREGVGGVEKHQEPGGAPHSICLRVANA